MVSDFGLHEIVWLLKTLVVFLLVSKDVDTFEKLFDGFDYGLELVLVNLDWVGGSEGLTKGGLDFGDFLPVFLEGESLNWLLFHKIYYCDLLYL